MKIIKKKILILIILLASLLLVKSVLAQGFGLNAVGNGLDGALSDSDPRILAGRIINIALGFLGTIVICFIAYAGFLWMTSNGEEEKVQKAKNILRNSLIGLVIILLSWAIASFIINQLLGVINGGNGGGGGCVANASCGCGNTGTLSCVDGRYGDCMGVDPTACSIGHNPTSCNGSTVAGTCSPVQEICASSDYCDSTSCLCKPRGNFGDSCNTSASSSSCIPNVNGCSQYLTCNPGTCTCFGPPVITEISSGGGFCNGNINQKCSNDSDCSGVSCNLSTPNGAANNFITIFGKNFGEYVSGSSTVTFMGSVSEKTGKSPSDLNPACIDTWRDDQIIIAIPAGAEVGPIKVQNKEGLFDLTNDDKGASINNFAPNAIQRPGLCKLSPTQGKLSVVVAYEGINLLSGSAYFGKYDQGIAGLDSNFTNPDGLSGTSTIPNIKSGDSSSFVENTANLKSNYLRFKKDPELGEGLFVSSFSPTSGNIGQYVTIRGGGFGSMRGVNHVYFEEGANSIEASYNFPTECANSVWKNNQIIVKVPEGLVNGNYKIKITVGALSIDTLNLNPNFFQFDNNADLRTSLCKIEPERGPAGTPVVLWGEYFGTSSTEALVKFSSDKNATGTIRENGQAKVIATDVPNGAITGPVKVIKNSLSGNELNFAVGECVDNSDCGTQICCPSTTYKKGRCVNDITKCFIDIPTSVFEWKFNTGYGNATVNPFAYSCSGMAQYTGSCRSTGGSCPNTPGACSSYPGGNNKVVGSCDTTCASTFSLFGTSTGIIFGSNTALTSDALGRCLSPIKCSLPKKIDYNFGTATSSSSAICNSQRHWQIELATSCPDNWTRTDSNHCSLLTSNCDPGCSNGQECISIFAVNNFRCVSPRLCLTGSTCDYRSVGHESDAPGIYNCVKPDQPSCECCCTKGQDARDCCAPLKCVGSCGANTDPNSATGFGKCGGCKLAGNTVAERDNACNCSGHSGQFCDTDNPNFPSGVCSDCSNLVGTQCTNHSSACCLDSRNTASSTADDICRGGDGRLVNNTSSTLPYYGYCAYYKCSGLTCATTTPLGVGDFNNVSTCSSSCALADPCKGKNNVTDCMANSQCCFDTKRTSTTTDDICRLGNQISGSSDAGYCAYYNCDNSVSACNVASPTKDGSYSSTSTCSSMCVPRSGAGQYCGGKATSTLVFGTTTLATTTSCNHSLCSFPGFACLKANGSLGSTIADCGTCCCQPGLPTASDTCALINPKLKCEPGRGSCSGASRGLCCGCSADSECSSPATSVGCGSDTCCQARPKVDVTSPAAGATNVCLNASVKIGFNLLMSASSFKNNFLLLYDNGSNTCPEGTFVGAASSVDQLLAKQTKPSFFSWLNVKSIWKKVAVYFGLGGSNQALATLPDANHVYCSVPGLVSGEDEGGKTSLIFEPSIVLKPDTKYYPIVLGDIALNSQSGVLSSVKIGMNGNFYHYGAGTENVSNVKFNNKLYLHSEIFTFTTITDASSNSGICAIDKVKTNPTSYLFRTTANDLNEDDSNANSPTFDTVADSDKVFSASAYSADGQLLHPVPGYTWTWSYRSLTTGVVSVNSGVTNLLYNKILVRAKEGITDAETKIEAKVNMPGGNISNLGNGFTASSDVYVFVCNNPWPPVPASGNWSPWQDGLNNCLPDSGNCPDQNYKFYYCRDTGAAGTLDDLPAIAQSPVIRGQATNLFCSSDHSSCTTQNSSCGIGGICIYSALKESYFFREEILPGASMISVIDTTQGKKVIVNWKYVGDAPSSFKVYYFKSGSSISGQVFKGFGLSNCSVSGTIYTCNATIDGLINNINYLFQVSVISGQQTESPLSSGMVGKPTDKIPPMTPNFPSGSVVGNNLRFTWQPNTDDTSSYKLYRAFKPGSGPFTYGEYFPSNSLIKDFVPNKFGVGAQYFALSAVDAYKNESGKSDILQCYIFVRQNGTCKDLTTPGCLMMNCLPYGDIQCSDYFNLPASEMTGITPVNSTASGRDTSLCSLAANWHNVSISSGDITEADCFVRMFTSNNIPVCNSSAATNQLFKGKFRIEGTNCSDGRPRTYYCLVTYKDLDGVTKTCQPEAPGSPSGQEYRNDNCRYPSCGNFSANRCYGHN